MIGVVVALGSEARTVRPLAARGDHRMLRGGLGLAAARAAALRLADAGAGGLLVWGVAGALVDGLEGALLLPSSVIAPDGARYEVDAAWHERVAGVLARRFEGRVDSGALVTAAAPVAPAAERAALAARTGAGSVDMESAAVAEVARERSLPLLVVRSVLDTPATPWPAALSAVGQGSGWRWRVLLSAVTGVSDWPAWPKVAAAHADACRRLLRAARCLAEETTGARAGAGG